MIDKSFFEEPKKSEDPSIKDLLDLLGQFEILSRIKFLNIRVDTDLCGIRGLDFDSDVSQPCYRVTFLSENKVRVVKDFIVPLYDDKTPNGTTKSEVYGGLIDFRDSLVKQLSILDSLDISFFSWEKFSEGRTY